MSNNILGKVTKPQHASVHNKVSRVKNLEGGGQGGIYAPPGSDRVKSIRKVQKLLSFDACASLIHALIGSRLDYCTNILYNLPDSKISRLQRVQNQAARILTRSPRREHITPVLKQLRWL